MANTGLPIFQPKIKVSSTFRYTIEGFVAFEVKKQLHGHQEAKLISQAQSTPQQMVIFCEVLPSEEIFVLSLRAVVRENPGFFLKFGNCDLTDFDEILTI